MPPFHNIMLCCLLFLSEGFSGTSSQGLFASRYVIQLQAKREVKKYSLKHDLVLSSSGHGRVTYMPVPLAWGESGDEVSRSEALTLDKDITTAKEANNGTTSKNDVDNTTARAEPLNNGGFRQGPPPPISVAVASVTSMLHDFGIFN